MLAECGVITRERRRLCTRWRRCGRMVSQHTPTWRASRTCSFASKDGSSKWRADAGGNLQLARSRNDLGHALARMALRRRLVEAGEQLLALRRVVMAQARRHLDTLMPGYTHTQPAQPVTLLPTTWPCSPFWRTTRQGRQRLRHRQHVTGSSCPDRHRLSHRPVAWRSCSLRRHRPQHATCDRWRRIPDRRCFCDQALAIDLARMTHDLLVRATQEANALRIDDSFIQISSIMPQKRNPVVGTFARPPQPQPWLCPNGRDAVP